MMMMAEDDEDTPVRRLHIRALPPPTSSTDIYLAAILEALNQQIAWLGDLLDELSSARADVATLRAALPVARADEAGPIKSDSGEQQPPSSPVAERAPLRRRGHR